MKKYLFSISLVFFAFSTYNLHAQNAKITYQSTESRDFEPRQGVIVTPLLADLKIITQSSVCDSLDFPVIVSSIAPSQMESWVSEFKKQAMSTIMKKYKADAIVASLTDVKTTLDGRMRIIITGYPAKYVNFRNATSTDVWMVSLYSIIDKNATGTLSNQGTNTVLIK